MIGFEGPAFTRRATRVFAEWNLLQERCRGERERLLEMPRIRLAQLRAVAGGWSRTAPLIGDELCVQLEALHAEWDPRLRVSPRAARREAELRQAVDRCADSFCRFNSRWQRFIAEVDLDRLNQLRRGYNAWYVIEKECAVGSARTARGMFEPLPMATADTLLRLFPLLPEFHLRVGGNGDGIAQDARRTRG